MLIAATLKPIVAALFDVPSSFVDVSTSLTKFEDHGKNIEHFDISIKSPKKVPSTKVLEALVVARVKEFSTILSTVEAPIASRINPTADHHKHLPQAGVASMPEHQIRNVIQTPQAGHRWQGTSSFLGIITMFNMCAHSLWHAENHGDFAFWAVAFGFLLAFFGCSSGSKPNSNSMSAVESECENQVNSAKEPLLAKSCDTRKGLCRMESGKEPVKYSDSHRKLASF
jgi:hypothetical protein